MPGSPPIRMNGGGDNATAERAIELLDAGRPAVRPSVASMSARVATGFRREQSASARVARPRRCFRRPSRRVCSRKRSPGHLPSHFALVTAALGAGVDRLLLGHAPIVTGRIRRHALAALARFLRRRVGDQPLARARRGCSDERVAPARIRTRMLRNLWADPRLLYPAAVIVAAGIGAVISDLGARLCRRQVARRRLSRLSRRSPMARTSARDHGRRTHRCRRRAAASSSRHGCSTRSTRKARCSCSRWFPSS